MENYKVYLWRGKGYVLDAFDPQADNEEQALYNVCAQVVNNNLTEYYLTVQQHEEYLRDLGINEEQDETYIYIDATMEGANYPVYLIAENMKIIKSNK